MLTERLPNGSARTYFRLACAFAVIVALLVVFQYGARGVARRSGLVALPQPLTELYFSHPNRLPDVLHKSEKLDLSFVINNEEGSRHDYRWSVNFVRGAKNRVLDAGVTTVANHQIRQLIAKVRTPDILGTGKIEVKLVSPSQEIDIHVNVVASTARTSGTNGP